MNLVQKDQRYTRKVSLTNFWGDSVITEMENWHEVLFALYLFALRMHCEYHYVHVIPVDHENKSSFEYVPLFHNVYGATSFVIGASAHLDKYWCRILNLWANVLTTVVVH